MFKIRKVRNLESSLEDLIKLDRICFPGDDPYNFSYKKQDHHWWIAYDENNKAVAFAGSLWWEPDKGFYLCRAGTLPSARGFGLQKKMIEIRCAHAKRSGARVCYTYTLISNHISSNNLIRKGFRLFKPKLAWVGREGKLYWFKAFKIAS